MADKLDELRSIEGFPKGKDEDLLALSNPPLYTAYPNPHIEDFISQYGNPYDEATDDYYREPFVSDVSEGKNDPIYNAHSYHTKVPYKAIMPFIEHYTQPGDIVFDGFCGTGMTGVAAQMSRRNAILCDLSTIACFISSNANSTVQINAFKTRITKIILDVKKELEWVYKTKHSNGQFGLINYVIWSDVFICPICGNELVYWDDGLDAETGESLESFNCKKCNALLKKRELKRSFIQSYDEVLSKDISIASQIPVLINYTFSGKRYTKKIDPTDVDILEKIDKSSIPYWYPSYRMPDGDEARRNDPIGATHTHQYYTKRNLWVLAAIYSKLDINNKYELYWFTSLHSRLHRLNRYMANHNRHVGPLSGTLYISSTPVEINVFNIAEDKLQSMIDAGEIANYSNKVIVTNQSTTDLRNIPNASVDYIFTDPPFGSNLMYSDLNFLLEGWLRAFTNNNSEAVICKTNNKGLDAYRDLMTGSFSEMFRILKPGRWITVEFHNSKASVWNAIQEALSHAGFIVAQVTVIDKQKGTTKQLTYASAVKNDLVINAYKPDHDFIERLISKAGHGLEADFVRNHLQQLPVTANIERSKEMLYSKYLAYYVQHGYQVAYNSEQFYSVLTQWGMEERDGFWFADETEANQYEKRKIKSFGKKGPQPQAALFIGDERSARQWIWNFLDEPKTYDEIYTDFLKALQTSEDEIPEVKVILEESFVRTNGHWKRPDQLTQAELEKKRLERLLRQFEEYLNIATSNQKLKEVRLEAVIAGFTECYRAGRYKDILTVGRKLDKGLLENSTDLYDFIDIAEAKVEG